MFLKILVFLFTIGLCIIIVRYRYNLVQTIGKNEWAEKYLGTGGTYTMWILIALLFVLMALVWMVGFPGVR